ncbi:fused gamma-glutamyl-gamma-aminobutyrate hydrolase/peptidase [Prevotella sp. oral taxon 376]|uniref:membrane dipeptidase n=1 Tax=Prevotella sp. oral taxon 376 TaxID=712466 RepID=UPI000D1F377C|nr:membrane dipeptidase [Prevotella sp. oral taxon 376]PTL33789.1 fused gamma-glutamyl-gamma-aminobutyrate hydrolase/peptidase [Prevotella sp. oral taxon 376]
MNKFSLEAHLEEVYATFPEARRRPVIGITANYVDGDATLRDRYYKQVVAAGGMPMLIPPVADKEVIVNTLELIDGLLLTGGGDYNPLWAGEEPQRGLHAINAERDLPELLITRLAYNRQIPMLGICRGIQTLSMALGGTVIQDIDARIKHSQDADRSLPTHRIKIIPDSTLYNIYGEEEIYVNTFHHQAVGEPGNRFRVTALSEDGIVEAIEGVEYKPIMGVQWHPEWLEEEGLKLFQWLVGRAGEFARAKALHDKILTLDTHCDTPMFFPQGIRFATRDSRILVDLHKMTEGRQDAVTMVAYLEQPKEGRSFCEIAPFEVEGPRAYADLIFDKIGTILGENAPYIAQACTPEELYAHKRAGKKSIMLGIENGLAIENDLANIRHFAERGIVYITLCHNGDNAICDSARGSHTHNGVSEFGEQVIHEMNRLGVMVDLSHGGEKSFYDALEISTMPIVCSHSNCKALCDVPRNLTDDQLRALARKGGVAHVTLYHGFLRKDSEASILDVMQHLEHAIQVMGIDHVGLGTDFDGDGGVRGMADSSEMINFTLQLLRRKFSEEDIAKVWGGNWLRVMRQVQSVK